MKETTEQSTEKPAAESVKELLEADFETAVLKATQPVVLDFFASDSEACKQLEPRFGAVAGKFAGKVVFFRVHRQKSAALAQKLGVTGSPTLVFFKGGQETGKRLEGDAIQRTALKAAVEAMLA